VSADGPGYLAELSDGTLIRGRTVLFASGVEWRRMDVPGIDDLLGADEVFLTSSMREVHPVSAVDDRAFDSDAPVTARTAAAVGQRLTQELA